MKIDGKKYPLPRRIRHHVSPALYLPISELKTIPANYPPVVEKLDWGKLFARKKAPDYLDVGCGKGAFLLSLAETRPEKNVLGIEVRKPLAEWINSVVQGEKIPNAAALWHSAANGFPFLENESVEKVFYLFPDPWFKKKHVKRRAFNLAFLEEVFRILKPNGELLLATDVEIVDEYHKEVLSEFGKLDFKAIDDESEWNYPKTNKESFCIRKGIPYYRIIARKTQ